MNTIRNRAKEIMPSVLLTLMSIMQALALEFLWGVVQTTERAWTWSSGLAWLQIIANMLGILQVWLFYTSVAMRFRWVPKVRDLLLPFLIGVLEFTLIDLTGNDRPSLWFFTLAAVFLVATLDAQNVFVRARRDPDNDEYFSTISPATVRDLLPPMLIVAGLLLFGMALEMVGSYWLELAGLLFAAGVLAHRVELSRRFWDASMREA